MSSASAKEKRANPVTTIYHCLKIVLESGHIKPFVISSIWAIASAFLTFTAIFEKNFFNSAAELVKAPSSSLYRDTMIWLAVWMGVWIGISLISYVTKRMTAGMWYTTSFFVRERLMWKLGRAKLEYFENTDTYYKLFFVKNNLSDNLAMIITKSFQSISNVLKWITAAAIIVSDNWLIAVIVVAGTIPTLLLSSRQTEEQFEQSKTQSFAVRFQDYLLILLVKLKFMKEVRFGNLYNYLKERYETSVMEVHGYQKKTLMKYYYANIGASAFSYLTVFAALLLIAYDIYKGNAGIGSFMLVLTCTQNIQGAMTSMFGDYMYITSQGRVVSYYKEVMQFKEEPYHSNRVDNTNSYHGKVFSGAPGRQQRQVTEIDSYDIEFRNVSFRYPGSDRLILDDVSVKIGYGEKIAVIGENGSGKSTFISLLCGLYEPDRGQVLFGGRDIKDDIGPLRSHVSVALQDFGKYHMTFGEQIRLGDLSREVPDEEVLDAARLSGAYDFIAASRRGLHTPVGSLQQGSLGNLSGGQWQKLVIARVLLKKDAKVLILDEPTAALDPNAESKLYNDFNRMTKGKTSILISHRLGAAKLADRVLLFHQGRIAEAGTHEELMRLDGLYAKMYRAQSQWYV